MTKAKLIWLPGWAMSGEVFSELICSLPECEHVRLDYSGAGTVEEFYEMAESAVEKCFTDSYLSHSTFLSEDASAPESRHIPLILIGWSLGGIIAQRLAAEKVYPINGLILISSTSCFVRPRDEAHLGWSDVYLRRMQTKLQDNRQQVIADFCDRMFTPSKRQSVLTKHDNPHIPADTWSLQALYAGLDCLRHQDNRPLLPQIACPTLILHGGADQICPPTAAQELEDNIPKATLHICPDGGHMPFLNYPTQFSDHLRRFLYEMG
ncbi:alpha/beta fold hydrolase [Brevibacillus dissolubilis]|uniref:alpha/beta fold hydrolase n=1 Tax=Brevibacillus dissolubilis TaxID=1844116 RepID=UPI001116E9C9|nr:alpha/beta fold hydrolase [Brevibacillus dissolubilis]